MAPPTTRQSNHRVRHDAIPLTPCRPRGRSCGVFAASRRAAECHQPRRRKDRRPRRTGCPAAAPRQMRLQPDFKHRVISWRVHVTGTAWTVQTIKALERIARAAVKRLQGQAPGTSKDIQSRFLAFANAQVILFDVTNFPQPNSSTSCLPIDFSRSEAP